MGTVQFDESRLDQFKNRREKLEKISNGRGLRDGGFLIVMLAEEIHGFAELMHVDEGPHQDEGTKDVPSPEVAGAEVVGDGALGQGLLHASRDVMMPDQHDDGHGDQGEDVSEQVVHGAGAILLGGDLVEIEGEGDEEDDAVYTEGEDIEQHELPHGAVGFELGRLVGAGFAVGIVLVFVGHSRNPFVSCIRLWDGFQ